MNQMRRFPLPATFLIVAEMVFVIGSIWWPTDGHQSLISFLISATLFCIGGALLARQRVWLLTYLPLTLLVVGTYLFGQSHSLLIMREGGLILIFGLLFTAIIRHSWFNHDASAADRILAGISGYLLLGIFWTAQFNLLSSLEPNSLQDIVTEETPYSQEVLYYSFITVTAVGYGDIAPVTPAARVVAIFASLSGTLYLAVFISALVGGRARE